MTVLLLLLLPLLLLRLLLLRLLRTKSRSNHEPWSFSHVKSWQRQQQSNTTRLTLENHFRYYPSTLSTHILIPVQAIRWSAYVLYVQHPVTTYIHNSRNSNNNNNNPRQQSPRFISIPVLSHAAGREDFIPTSRSLPRPSWKPQRVRMKRSCRCLTLELASSTLFDTPPVRRSSARKKRVNRIALLGLAGIPRSGGAGTFQPHIASHRLTSYRSTHASSFRVLLSFAP
jgi:hypothetical protein